MFEIRVWIIQEASYGLHLIYLAVFCQPRESHSTYFYRKCTHTRKFLVAQPTVSRRLCPEFVASAQESGGGRGGGFLPVVFINISLFLLPTKLFVVKRFYF